MCLAATCMYVLRMTWGGASLEEYTGILGQVGQFSF